MTPQISDTLLIPRVNYWQKHGWRAEVVIDDLAMGDIIIGEFVETREEAERAASQLATTPRPGIADSRLKRRLVRRPDGGLRRRH